MDEDEQLRGLALAIAWLAVITGSWAVIALAVILVVKVWHALVG